MQKITLYFFIIIYLSSTGALIIPMYPSNTEEKSAFQPIDKKFKTLQVNRINDKTIIPVFDLSKEDYLNHIKILTKNMVIAFDNSDQNEDYCPIQ